MDEEKKEEMVSSKYVLENCPNISKNNLFKRINGILNRPKYFGECILEKYKDSITGRFHKIFWMDRIFFTELLENVKDKEIKKQLDYIYYESFYFIPEVSKLKDYIMSLEMDIEDKKETLSNLRKDIKAEYHKQSNKFHYVEDVEKDEEDKKKTEDIFKNIYSNHEEGEEYEYEDTDGWSYEDGDYL